MFTGIYICTLDKKGRFRIPKRYRKILAENAEEKGILFFAAADALRVYTQKDIRELADQLQSCPEVSEPGQALPLIRSALSTGMAFHTPFGMVVIQERLRKRYNLIPGTRLLVRGNLKYFEICIHEQEKAC